LLSPIGVEIAVEKKVSARVGAHGWSATFFLYSSCGRCGALRVSGETTGRSSRECTSAQIIDMSPSIGTLLNQRRIEELRGRR